MTKQQKTQTFWYWLVFLVIAIPSACINGISSIWTILVFWACIYGFAVLLTWFLNKIKWE